MNRWAYKAPDAPVIAVTIFMPHMIRMSPGIGRVHFTEFESCRYDGSDVQRDSTERPDETDPKCPPTLGLAIVVGGGHLRNPPDGFRRDLVAGGITSFTGADRRDSRSRRPHPSGGF